MGDLCVPFMGPRGPDESFVKWEGDGREGEGRLTRVD